MWYITLSVDILKMVAMGYLDLLYVDYQPRPFGQMSKLNTYHPINV